MIKDKRSFYSEIDSKKRSTDIRLNQLIQEQNNVFDAHKKRIIFWESQKKDIFKNIEVIKNHISGLIFDINNNKIKTQKIVLEFRKKVKLNDFDNIKLKIDSLKLEQFLTKKRFIKLINIIKKES